MVDQQDAAPQYDWQRTDVRRFEFGDVLGRAFSLLGRHFLPFFITALVIIGLPALLAVAGLLVGMGSGGGVVSATAMVGFVISVVAALVGAILLPAAVIYAALRGWSGNPVSMRESVGVMLRRFFSLLGLGILAGIGIFIGLILFIVPGFILICGWYVAVAAMVMERKGVTASLSRSWELTKGYKGQIFGLVLVVFVISLLISAVFSVPALMMGEGAVALGEQPADVGVGVVVAQILSVLGDIVSNLVGALVAASAYFELRRVREGVTLDSIADIFS